MVLYIIFGNQTDIYIHLNIIVEFIKAFLFKVGLIQIESIIFHHAHLETTTHWLHMHIHLYNLNIHDKGIFHFSQTEITT